MYVIISGCGRVGSLVARMLSAEGHDLVVVDNDPDSFDRLGSGFNGLTVLGYEFDVDTLRKAGIEQADVFVAAGNSDSANVMATLIAKEMFGVERVVCRIYEPDHEHAFQRLGIPTLAASAVAAARIRNEVLPGGLWTDVVLGNGQAQVIRLRPTRGIDHRTVREVEREAGCRITAVVRGRTDETVLIPDDETELRDQDLLLIAVETAKLGAVRALLGC